MPPTTDIGNNFVIGDPKSPSHTTRLEWLLNQMRLSLAASSNPPDYTGLLNSIFGAVDELELKADQIDLTNSQINLSVDQVEALINTAIARLNSLLIVASQSDNKLASLLISANLQDVLLNAIANATTQILIEQPIQTAYLSQAAALLNNIASEVSLLIAPDLDSVKTDTAAILAVLQSVNSWLAVISNYFYDEQLGYLQRIEAYLDRAERGDRLKGREVIDISGLLNGNVWNYPPDVTIRRIKILNNTGGQSGNPIERAWVYGRYWGQAINPPSPPTRVDCDFIIAPGELLDLDKNSTAGVMIAAEGFGSESGAVIINRFELF